MVVGVSQTEVEHFITVQVFGTAVEAEVQCFFAVVARLTVTGVTRVGVTRVTRVWAVCVAVLKELVANLSGIFSRGVTLAPQIVETFVGSIFTLLWIQRLIWLGWVTGVTGVAGVTRVTGVGVTRVTNVALAGAQAAFETGGTIFASGTVAISRSRTGFKARSAMQTLGGWGRRLAFACALYDGVAAHL
jgi:hypothetical protein